MNGKAYTFITDDRDSDYFNALLEIFERLGWESYPTHYDSEELDAMEGSYPDDANEQTVYLPAEDDALWDILKSLL